MKSTDVSSNRYNFLHIQALDEAQKVKAHFNFTVIRSNIRTRLPFDPSKHKQYNLNSDSVADPATAETKKHEIYVAAFGGHLFHYLFLQGLG